MNWTLALLLCFVLWTTYAIPGNLAEKVHGVSVNMLFETLAFVVVAFFLSGKILADISKVTLTSGIQASLMGIGSAVGFYFFLTALSLAPGTKGLALVILVAGMTFPAQSALFGLFSGGGLAVHQWLAIAGMGACIGLYNWKF
ncbi:MAG: hypothetical protein A3D65_01410 [Candidatus Lloydbacteria bacterium RIFCSPHIGHO2_02_FULL_50_13]|uniref:Uncharacterized protein n=1 Tax=Candidatus Lloydbacteria bacterium RIFCSPHIGHO2_02_FULL_50_13 TaxID=1798661 RepID=A0A1G2D2N8_9BACT|nr:MAG: hypothetical protein A3D65_01410 [Candidatus Lloydbacteria bacterium RIFCSPHIGHO2_02_FULL_50_13]